MLSFLLYFTLITSYNVFEEDEQIYNNGVFLTDFYTSTRTVISVSISVKTSVYS